MLVTRATSPLAPSVRSISTAAPSLLALLPQEAPTKKPLKTVNIFVDGKEFAVPDGVAVIQACALAGVDIPRFCYHDNLSVAGNCRMCLVQIEMGGRMAPKPQASCAVNVTPGMKVFTTTPVVKQAREGVMEFLLANHPLDCPICDEGGECDLQDQAMAFGSDRGRFEEEKRVLIDRNWGPYLKTIMTRCISCTRCVRWARELGGNTDLGVLGRGNTQEIGMYIDIPFEAKNGNSGDVVEYCPVGSLTNASYSFSSSPSSSSASSSSASSVASHSSTSTTEILASLAGGAKTKSCGCGGCACRSAEQEDELASLGIRITYPTAHSSGSPSSRV